VDYQGDAEEEEEQEEEEEEDEHVAELSGKCSDILLPKVLAKVMPVVERAANKELPGVLKIPQIKKKIIRFVQDNLAVIVTGAAAVALLAAKKKLAAMVSKIVAQLRKTGKITKKRIFKKLNRKKGKAAGQPT
jgi:hypothetical protein